MEMQSGWILEGQGFSFAISFSLPDLSRIQHSEGESDDLRFLGIKPVRLVANVGFFNQEFDWNAMPEGGMPGLRLLPESLEKLRVNF